MTEIAPVAAALAESQRKIQRWMAGLLRELRVRQRKVGRDSDAPTDPAVDTEELSSDTWQEVFELIAQLVRSEQRAYVQLADLPSFTEATDWSKADRLAAALSLLEHLVDVYDGLHETDPTAMRVLSEAVGALLADVRPETWQMNACFARHARTALEWVRRSLPASVHCYRLFERMDPTLSVPEPQRDAWRGLLDGLDAPGSSEDAFLFHHRLRALLGEYSPLTSYDQWAIDADAYYRALPWGARQRWSLIIDHCSTTTQSKPSQRWFKELDVKLANVDAATLRRELLDFLGLYSRPQRAGSYGGTIPGCSGLVNVPMYRSQRQNEIILRALLWLATRVSDIEVLQSIGTVALSAFTKLRGGAGARSMVVGNAAVACLEAVPETMAIAQLMRIRDRITYAQPKQKITRRIDELAAKRGLAAEDLEELMIPEMTLGPDHALQTALAEYHLTASITERAPIIWRRNDQSVQPSAALRRTHAADLKRFEKHVTATRQLYQVWRSRIEATLRSGRRWRHAEWLERLVQRPLLYAVAENLIWRIDDNRQTMLALLVANELQDIDGKPVAPRADSTVSLWHPVESDAAEVRSWQNRLVALDLLQPFKQAFRETYELDQAAETRRFANRLVRQQQFAMLTKARGWTFDMIGVGGEYCMHNHPRLQLESDTCAVLEVAELKQGPTTQTGYYQYLVTGAFAIRDAQRNVVKGVSARAFSEVARDADLFASVSAIASEDPSLDIDPALFADHFSVPAAQFLSCFERTRRDMLIRLLAKSSIADRCCIEDRYLCVRGNLHRYRIHLGTERVFIEGEQRVVEFASADPEPSSSVIRHTRWHRNDPAVLSLFNKAVLLAGDADIKQKNLVAQLSPTSR